MTRAGRPPLDPKAPSIRMSFRVPLKTYDELYTRAKAAKVSMAEFVRSQLRPPRNSVTLK
jgi:hypothetical protein